MNENEASRRTAITGGVDIDALAVAVRSCAGVSDLAAGPPGSAATYLPGRRVAGIAVDDARVRVQLRVRWAVRVDEIAAQVRDALRPLVGARTIDIIIADIDDPPGERQPDGEESPATPSVAPGTGVLQPPPSTPPTTPPVGARSPG